VTTTLERERRTAIDTAVAAADGNREWSRTNDWLAAYLIDPDTAADRADQVMAEAGWYRTRNGWRRT
jgi:hypothetical protein